MNGVLKDAFWRDNERRREQEYEIDRLRAELAAERPKREAAELEHAETSRELEAVLISRDDLAKGLAAERVAREAPEAPEELPLVQMLEDAGLAEACHQEGGNPFWHTLASHIRRLVAEFGRRASHPPGLTAEAANPGATISNDTSEPSESIVGPKVGITW